MANGRREGEVSHCCRSTAPSGAVAWHVAMATSRPLLGSTAPRRHPHRLARNNTPSHLLLWQNGTPSSRLVRNNTPPPLLLWQNGAPSSRLARNNTPPHLLLWQNGAPSSRLVRNNTPPHLLLWQNGDPSPRHNQQRCVGRVGG